MKNSTVNASTKFIWTLRRVRRSNKSCEMWIWRERDHIFRIYHNRRRDEIASRTLLTPFSKHRTLSNICEGTSKSLTSTDVSYKSTQPNLQLFNDLLKVQRKCSAYDCELLSMYTALKRFRYAVKGTDSETYTNHKPLTYAFNQNLDKCLPRQFCHLQLYWTIHDQHPIYKGAR